MANGTPDWRVTSVIPATDFNLATGPVQGSNVHFTTISGLSDHVFISDAQVGDVEAVAQKINDKVAALNAIQNLTG